MGVCDGLPKGLNVGVGLVTLPNALAAVDTAGATWNGVFIGGLGLPNTGETEAAAILPNMGVDEAVEAVVFAELAAGALIVSPKVGFDNEAWKGDTAPGLVVRVLAIGLDAVADVVPKPLNRGMVAVVVG